MRPKAASKEFHVSRFTFHALRFAFHVLRFTPCILLISCCLTSCSFPASTHPTFKIGLVAPFEGHYRQVGYDAIYAARLAVRQANRSGVGGYRVELLALDDGGDPQVAAQQASMLALDPAMMGVIGHFGLDTSFAAAPIYAREGLPLLIPAAFPPDAMDSTPTVTETLLLSGAPCPHVLPDAEQFSAEYAAVSGGTQPGPYAWAAYQAVQALLEAACLDIEATGVPSRGGVDGQLRSQCSGDSHSDNALVYVYRGCSQ